MHSKLLMDISLNMYSLVFKGRFELENPDSFLNQVKEILEKEHGEYYGQISTEDMGRYVDYQKIEEPVVDE